RGETKPLLDPVLSVHDRGEGLSNLLGRGFCKESITDRQYGNTRVDVAQGVEEEAVVSDEYQEFRNRSREVRSEGRIWILLPQISNCDLGKSSRSCIPGTNNAKSHQGRLVRHGILTSSLSQ